MNAASALKQMGYWITPLRIQQKIIRFRSDHDTRAIDGQRHARDRTGRVAA